MDPAIEQVFVSTFIYKNMRARFLFELQSAKYRQHCIHRFCHETEKHIKADMIHTRSSKHSVQSLIAAVNELTDSKACYVLACEGMCNGKSLPLRQAVEDTFYHGMAVILIMDEKTAVIKAEQSFGPPTRYILHAGKA